MNNPMVLDDITSSIALADKYVKRTYLNDLAEYDVVPLEESLKKFNSIRLYRVSKLIFDAEENINDKLVSVFNAVQNIKSNLVFIIRSREKTIDFYIGVQSDRDIGIADKIFAKSFLGNFPGSVVAKISREDTASIMEEAVSFNALSQNLACLDVIPSNRNDNEKDTFIQGLEKFIDTMQGEDYTCIILGSSISDDACEERMRGYEELYTALFPLSNQTVSQGTSEGTTLTNSYTQSVSDSITKGISKTIGENQSVMHNKGMNFGFPGIGIGFNFSNGTSSGEFSSTSDSSSSTRSDSTSRSTSESLTKTTTDNLTVNYKNKTVENVLENIDARIKRLRQCMVFGMWECAVYFVSDQVQTSVMAANAFRSLMLGDTVENEKSHLNSFGMRERISTENAIETLKYCRHPVFKTMDAGAERRVTATEYLSGRELPIMFSVPRKSVSGVTVTEMAEFGRNIVSINDNGEAKEENLNKRISIGHISHMNQTESQEVTLDLNSLSSHCFICGSTGSGKSNTTFNIIKELLKEDINIPFLVVEPAKGEYKYAFTNVENINIFTTTLQIGRFLKVNPFKFNTKIHVLEHLDRLIEIFNTCWEMYAAMPAILKDAIERSYVKKGWDLLNSIYIPGGEPEFPTFKDLLEELPKVISSSAYSADTKGDYIGALVTRVNSLTNGISGQVFCDCYDIEDQVLFDQKTIVDLSRVGSSETKSLIMGILVLKLTEHRIAEVGAVNSPLRHVTILEEAHNLLKNTVNASGPSSAIVSKSVEMLCSSIAEMRTYGEGFILVDQSPGAVDIAAIKNTNTKIIMRLPEQSDCEAIGHSVSLSDKQIAELSRLRTGHAIVMQSNWTDAIMAKINYYAFDFAGELQETPLDKAYRFRGFVLGLMLDEYAIKKTNSLNDMLKAVDEFDIDFYKKEDAMEMLRSFSRKMDRKWSSVRFAQLLMHYGGLKSIFDRAEEEIKDLPRAKDKGKETNRQTIEPLLNFVHDQLILSLRIREDQIKALMQYMLYAKAHEKSEINYDLVYRIRYIR